MDLREFELHAHFSLSLIDRHQRDNSNEGVLNSEIPFFCPTLAPLTPWDWNYTTTVQPGLGDRALAYPRGHILGGSSSISALQFYLVRLHMCNDRFQFV